MNDISTPAADKKSKSLGFIIPVILVIALISGVGYIITHSGIDKVAVVNALDSWKLRLQTGFANGTKGDFSYEDVEMHGGATSRHAILLNPELTIIADEQNEAQYITLKSPKVELHPSSVRMNSFKLLFKEPINFELHEGMNDTVSGVATSDIPTALHIKRESEGDNDYRLSSTLEIPTTLTIADAQKTDEQKTLIITTGAGAKLGGWMLESDSNVGESQAAISNLAISSSDPEDGRIEFGTISVDAKSEKLTADDYKVAARANIGDFVLPEAYAAYGKISADVDFGYSGPLPKDNGDPIDWTGKALHLDLKKLHIFTPDAGINLQADFKTVEGEMLPVGAGQLSVSNFGFIRDELRKHELLDTESSKLVDAMLYSIAGVKLDEAKDIEIPLQREAGKSMQIGKISFEEVFAILMTGGQISAPAHNHDHAPAVEADGLSRHDTPPVTDGEPAPVAEEPAAAETPNAEAPAEPVSEPTKAE